MLGVRLRSKLLKYREWIKQEADLIEADGCSFISNWNSICCLIHDLEYYYGKDSAHAYVLYLSGEKNYWLIAKTTTREKADNGFNNCNHRESFLGYLHPLAWLRRLVERLGKSAWDKHRLREQEERENANRVL